MTMFAKNKENNYFKKKKKKREEEEENHPFATFVEKCPQKNCGGRGTLDLIKYGKKHKPFN